MTKVASVLGTVNKGLELDKIIELDTLEAVVLEYTDFNDKTVENKKAQPFIDEIEGKKIK